VVGQPGRDLGVIGRIADHQVTLLRQPIDEQVVQHAPVFATHGVVDHLAGGDLRHPISHHSVQPGSGPGSTQLDLAHVGDIEEADLFPHDCVLGQDTAILHGHLVAGEGHHTRTALPMPRR